MHRFSLIVLSLAVAVAGCADKGAGVTDGTQGTALLDKAADVLAEMMRDDGPPAGAAGEPGGDTLKNAAGARANGLAPPLRAGATEPAVAEVPGAIDVTKGKSIYTGSCVACHGSGAAGAPRLGDAASWAARIGQGFDTLAAHAIQGFKGSQGYMPPRGGFARLSDEEVTAAVAYMVRESR